MLTVHIVLAYLSVTGFVLRMGWSVTAPDLLAHRFVRIAPHVVDTCLLVMGLLLAMDLPHGLQTPWLLAKLTALVGYIGFGVLALRGKGWLKRSGILGASLCVIYILAVAYTRSAIPWES